MFFPPKSGHGCHFRFTILNFSDWEGHLIIIININHKA